MNAHDHLEHQLRVSVAQTDRGSSSWLRRARRRLSGGLSALMIVAITAVALGVAVFAVIALRHGRPPSSHPSAAGQHQFLGVPPRQELRYLGMAFIHVANTPGSPCRSGPPYEPTIAHGPPGQPLFSTVGVLRRPWTQADRLPATLQGLSGGSVYFGRVRRARVSDGVSYYVVPVTAMLLSGRRSPACERALRAALKAELPHIPARLRAPTLALQAEQAAYERRLQRQGNQPGVCLVAADHQGQAASCGATVPELKQFGVISWNGPLAGIVPNGVASITVNYPSVNGQPAQTATSNVIGNVFVTSIHAGSPRTFRPAMTWRSAAGTIIKKIPPQGPFSELHYASWCSQNLGSGFC